MPARWKFRHNSPGLAELLKSAEMHAMVEDATRQIAETAQQNLGQSIPVGHEVVTTDRAHGIVAIQHPNGIGVEGRTGALNRSAGALGLTIRKRR